MSESIPLDVNRCQTDRPSTWPDMPTFMTLGPVTWKRCENTPKFVATDLSTGGFMSLCDECREVMEGLFEEGRVALAEIGGRL